ncbi:MAG: M81 family metallopeptidase [Flaviflexus sp.]|nr:M81 family metallopeptidase [Flaviflexus sp.]
MSTLRIAIGGIHIESSTFTPYVSGAEDFTVLRGTELLGRYPWIGGADPEGEFADVQWVPLVHARALPGGVVSREFFESWHADFFDRLAAAHAEAPIDGVLFDIHGAMTVQDMRDAEGMIAAEITEMLPEAMIAAPMDLHGNVSPRLFAATDILTCYRTAPHVDTWETRLRAARELCGALRAGRRPAKARVAVPILLPGEQTSTSVEPAASIYRSIDELVGPGVHDVSVWMGFPWADEPRCHAAVVAYGDDERAVGQAAGEMAGRLWAAAEEFSFVGPTATVPRAIELAREASDHPFIISDTGDNPGAGGTGDSPAVLHALLDAEMPALFAALFDPVSVARARELGEGGVGVFCLGGREIEGRVLRCFDSEGVESAVVQAGQVRVIATAKRTQYARANQYEAAGEPLEAQSIIVCKIGYLEPDLAAAARGWVMALSSGAVDQDLLRIGHRNLSAPLFPFHRGFVPELEVEVVGPSQR